LKKRLQYIIQAPLLKQFQLFWYRGFFLFRFSVKYFHHPKLLVGNR